MLNALKKTLGLDEEGKKRRAKAREKVREEERRERAEHVRQEVEQAKKYAKQKKVRAMLTPIHNAKAARSGECLLMIVVPS